MPTLLIRGTYDSIDGSALLFGLGRCSDGASVEVRWTDGRVQTLTLGVAEISRYVRLTY